MFISFMKTVGTQTKLALLDSAFHDWVDYMKSNIEFPQLQPPTQSPGPHITAYQPPAIQQPPPPSNEQFENYYNELDKDEVYELKHHYEEFFNIELSISSFAGLKIIREHFTKTSHRKNMKRITIYHKK